MSNKDLNDLARLSFRVGYALAGGKRLPPHPLYDPPPPPKVETQPEEDPIIRLARELGL